MLRFVCLLTLVLSVLSTQLPIIYDYSTYISAWSSNKAIEISATFLSNKKQQCGQSSCEFYIYLYEDQQLLSDVNRDRTVLLVGGLRGDDHLGPTVMLNLYDKLKAARIIYFPVANPSGFQQKTSQTYPERVYIQDDFPIIGSQSCNKSSAVRILDSIFRKYSIDLTLYIQGGPPGLGYSWTTSHLNETVQEKQIYSYFFRGVQQVYKKYSGNQTVDEFTILSRRNPFIDWAYGASRYPDILLSSCNGEQYKKYGQKGMKGLAVTLSVGQMRDPANDQNNAYKYMLLGRAVQMVKYLVGFVNPRLQVKCQNDGGGVVVQVRLLGCGNAYLNEFKMMDANQVFMTTMSTMFLSGGEDEWSSMNLMGMKSGKVFPEKGIFEASYVCDNDWMGLGTTVFAQKREYKQSHSFEMVNKIQNIQQQKQQKHQEESQSGAKSTTEVIKFVGLCVLGILILAAIVNFGRNAIVKYRKRKSIGFRERFEEVENTQEQQFTHIHEISQLSKY